MSQTWEAEIGEGQGFFYLFFFLSLPPSLSTTCFLSLSTGVKENHYIIILLIIIQGKLLRSRRALHKQAVWTPG